MAMLTPGTPNSLRSCSTRSTNPGGGAALALAEANTRAIALSARTLCFSMSLLLDPNDLLLRGESSARARQFPNANGDEREDEGRKKDVGERPVASGNQRDEPEPACKEHAKDEHDGGDREALGVGQRMTGAHLPRAIDPLVDCVDRARSALEQRREDHRLEKEME